MGRTAIERTLGKNDATNMRGLKCHSASINNARALGQEAPQLVGNFSKVRFFDDGAVELFNNAQDFAVCAK